MNEYETEQALELEALESLFIRPGEFEKLSDTSFCIHLTPCAETEEDNHVGVTLRVEYPSTYPDVPPMWQLENGINLDNSDMEMIEAIVNDVIAASSGVTLIYDIADRVQSWLRENNRPNVSMHDEMMRRLVEVDDPSDTLSEKDEADNWLDDTGDAVLEAKILVDEKDRVTEEQFRVWAESFKKEMEEANVWKKDESAQALTGRQMFEQDSSLALDDAESYADAV